MAKHAAIRLLDVSPFGGKMKVTCSQKNNDASTDNDVMFVFLFVAANTVVYTGLRRGLDATTAV